MQEKAAKIVLGINLKPDEAYSFLLKVPTINSKLGIVKQDDVALSVQFSWVLNSNSEEQYYYFDISISHEGNLCDLKFTPASATDSEKLPNAVASVIEAMSSHSGIRIGEMRDYTKSENESPTDEEVEKVSAYLQKHVVADLKQISSDLVMLHLTVSVSASLD